MERGTPYGGIRLSTPTTQVQGGDAIRGEVLITVRKEVKFSEVRVSFSGKEKTEVITERRVTTTTGSVASHHRHRKRRVRHHSSATLCNVGASLVPGPLRGTHDGKWYTAAVGQYRVTFELRLPHSLPPTAQVGEARHSASNAYVLKARLLTKGAGVMSSLVKAVGGDAVALTMHVLPSNRAPEQCQGPLMVRKERSFMCSRCAISSCNCSIQSNVTRLT